MFKVRNANVNDAEQIYSLVSFYAAKGCMLQKSLFRVYSTIESFVVAENDSTIVGCASTIVLWKDLGEIRSLAVDEKSCGQGIGKMLVQHCIDKATRLRLPKLIVLTRQDHFFKHVGFMPVDKNKYQLKILADCLDCPKLTSCDESAYLFEL